MAVATRVVNWGDIMAECGNYKAGFVAVYRRYEGMETDERDGSNRIVKVTAATFAEHAGIPPRTFQNWVRFEVDADFSSTSAREQRTAVSHSNVAKNLARKDPVNLVTAIEDAGPQAMDSVYHELKLRRAGIPPSTNANRKAAEARASQVAEPWKQAMMRDSCETIPAVIDELTEDLEKNVAAGNVAAQTLNAIIDAATRLITTATAAKPFAQ